MNYETTQVSLTRKLRQLIGLPEIELSDEEAELYQLDSMDHDEPEYLNNDRGGNNHE